MIKENIKHLAQELLELSISLRVNIRKSNCDDFVKIYEEYHGESWHKNIFPYPGIIREDTPDGCRMCHTSYNLSEIVWLYEHFKNKGINVNFFPRHRGKGCMLQRSAAFIIGPTGELYKCWNDVSNIDKIIGNIMDNRLYNHHIITRYMHESGPFDRHCRDCNVFPICDGGCGMLRYRNMFENGEFIYCSPFKSIESLKLALLNSTKDNPDSHKKEIKI